MIWPSAVVTTDRGIFKTQVFDQSVADRAGVNHPPFLLARMTLPMGHGQRGITAEMTTTAFRSEQAGFEQERTGALTVA